MKQQFIQLLRSTNRQGIENVINWLEESDFFTAPASTMFHGNYAGGMIGYAGGNDLKIQMKNCVNRGVIQANSCAGGMSGLLIIDHLDQTNCYNYGTINAEQEAVDLNGHFSIMSDPAKGAHPNAPEGTSALRVMSFNLQSSLSSSGGNLTQAAKNRIEAVKQEILFYQPDVLGLQEDTEKWVSNLKLPGYKAIPISVSSGAHCSIYYKSDLKLLSQGSAYLSSTGLSDDVSLTYEDLSTPGSKYYMTPEELAIIGVENSADLKEKKNTYVDQQTGQTVTMKSGTYTLLIARRVSWAVFDINGQPVIYINTHLTNSNSTAEYSNDAFQKVKSMARLKEFDLIQQQLAKIKKNYPNAKVFMTGDWNDGVNTPIYNSIVNDCGYVCANFNAKEQYGAHGTWNNAFNVSKQGDTYPSANESATSSYLDYCFVDSTISPLKFIVGAGKAEITLADGSKKIIYTSDHFPIIADICFKNQ